MRGWTGLPFYMSITAPTDESTPIAFERNFNPDLKHDSEYFGNLNTFLKCVDKHTPLNLPEHEQNEVCKKEF